MQRAFNKRQAVLSRGSVASRTAGRNNRHTLVERAVHATLEQLENRQLMAGNGWTATWATGTTDGTNPRLVDSGNVVTTAGSGTFQRIESTVNWPNVGDAVMPSGAPSNWNNNGGPRGAYFAARWEGYIEAPADGVFTFFPSTDDGARISISGDLTANPGNEALTVLSPDNLNADRGITEDAVVAPAFVAGHFYKVRFDMNQGGGDWAAQLRWSGPNTPKAIIPQAAVYSANPTGSPAIQNVVAGNKAVQLTWNYAAHFPDDSTNANLAQIPTSYLVRRSTTAGGPYTTVGTVNVPAANQTTPQSFSFVDADPTLQNGTQYFYVVNADSPYPLAMGPASSEVSATPQNIGALDVANVVATRANGNGPDVTLTINPGGPIAQFNVYRADQDPVTLAQTGTFTKITASPISTTTFVDTGRTAPAFYKVTSITAAGESDPANAKIVYIGVGNGWSATYATAKDEATGNPRTVDGPDASTVPYTGVFYRIDPLINFGGGGTADVRPPGAPANWNNVEQPGRKGLDWAGRWEGYVYAQYSESYTFYSATDDGVRVSIETAPGTFTPIVDLIDANRGEPAAPGDIGTVPFAFEAGKRYLVRFESNQGVGDWAARLRWGSASQPIDIVPTSQVRALVPPPVATVATDPTFTLTPSPTSVVLAFRNVAATSYKIYRSTTPNVPTGPGAIPVGTVNATTGDVVSFNDTGLSPSTTYYYRVVATSLSGDGVASVEKSTTTNLVAPTTPANATIASGQLNPNAAGYTPTGTTINTVVTFDRTLFTTSYRLERAPIATPTTFATVATLTDSASGGRASITDPTSVVGQGYVYRVVAVNASGDSVPTANLTMDYRTGLQERFYANNWWNSPTQNTDGHKNVGAGTRTGVVPVINWNLSDQFAPPNGTQATNFSTAFTGKIIAPEAGDYLILAYTDDDSYVYVDGKLVSADPGGHGIPANTAVGQADFLTRNFINLTAGAHDIQVFQSQGGGGHGAILRWAIPSDPDKDVLDLVPTENLTNFTGVPSVAPTALTFQSSTQTSITFSFNDAATNELRFRVLRSESASGPFAPIAVLPMQDPQFGAGVTFTDAGVLPGKTYFYRVAAENFEGEAVSATSTGFTAQPPTITPGTNVHYYDSPLWGPGTRDTNSYRLPGLGVENVATKSDINASGGDNAPPDYVSPGDDALNFSVVFSGKLRTNAAQPANTTNAPETYRFVTQSDDDSYIVVNGKLVSSYPGGHGDDTNGTQTFAIDLLPNTEYNFQYYQSQGGGGWGYHMRWIAPGDTAAYPTAASLVNAPLIPSGNFTSNREDTPTIPAFPATDAVTEITGTTAKINFLDRSNSEIRYTLQRATTAAFTDPVDIMVPMVVVPQADTDGEAGTLASPGTPASFVDSGLTAGATYFYRLRAENYDGSSAYVNVPGPGAGGAVTTNLFPANIAAGPARTGEIAVEFNNINAAATNVEIQYSSDPTFATGVTTQSVAPAAGRQRVLIAGFTPGTRYYFRLRTTGPTPAGTTPFSPSASAVANNSVPTSTALTFDRAAGFGTPTATTPGFTLNGSSTVTADGRLRLTPNAGNQVGSGFTSQQVDVSTFIASFDMQWNQNPGADGMAFVIQRQGATALGGGGGAIGYAGIPNSVAVAFDIYDNEQKVALLVNGAGFDPATELDLTGAGFDFNSGNMYHVAVSYASGSMSLTITDTATPTTTFTTSVPINLETTIGGSTAYVGFTGATGGASSQQEILNFVFAPNTVVGPTLPAGATASAGATFTYVNGTLNLTSGTITFTQDNDAENVTIVASGANSRLVFQSKEELVNLTLTNGAKATVENSANAASRRALVVEGISVDATSQLDVGNNILIYRYAAGGGAAALTQITTLVDRAFNDGGWNGTGIASAAAAADQTFTTALGVANNSEIGYTSMGGETGLTGNEILVKYTYYGDADLTGAVDNSDLLSFQDGLQPATPKIWLFGDFDYDGTIGNSDLLAFQDGLSASRARGPL